jgi:hypothetical protein
MSDIDDAGRLQLTAYDLLGYLTPGGTMILSIFVFEYLVNTRVLHEHGARIALKAPLLESTTQLFGLTIASGSSVGVFVILAVLLALAYVVGHVIASVSALLLDRTLVFKGYGYPCSNLLRVPRADDPDRDLSRAYYRGIFFWTNVLLIATYTALFMTRYGSALLLWLSLGCAWLIVVVTALKLLISSRHGKHRNVQTMRRFTNSILRYVFAGVFDMLSHPLREIMSTQRSFDAEFLSLYRRLFRGAFGINVDTAGTNTFWLSYCYVAEKSEHLRTLLSFWRTMYTFARNLATAFYLAFLYCFCWLVAQLDTVRQYASLFPFYLPLILLACSYLLAVRYYYLYVCYFNKFVARAFVFLEQTRLREGGLPALVEEQMPASG